METRLIAVGAVLVIVLASLAFALMSISGSGTQQQANSSTTTAPIAFATSQFAPYSYLISGNNLTYQAKDALVGYTMQKTAFSDGSVNITISVNGTNATQSVVVKPGYKLYVVETSFGDDGGGFDSSRADDGFVLVDPNGYLVG